MDGFTTHTVRGEHERLSMRKGPPLAKPRKLYRFTGVGPNIRYGVHDHTIQNVRRGLMERVFCVEDKNKQLVPTPKPNPGEFNRLSGFYSDLRKHLTRTTRLTPQEFLGFYSGRKLERYQKAVESLDSRPVRPSDAWLTTFVKAEKLNLSAKPDPAPRVIQPRDARYNVEVGRFLRHSEEHLFKAIDKTFGGRTIFKGISADVAGMEFKNIWDSFSDPIGIGMDASRFDQHVSEDALRFEHNMWLNLFQGKERRILANLLEMQVHNRGIARCPDGEIRYTVDGCRMSGDMNTSSGNCYIMCATVYAWCHERGIKHFRLANNGDDCMVFLERRDEDKFRHGLIDYYRGLGFTMKVEPTVDVLERVEFCQTHPIDVNGSYRMIRRPHASMSKDLHSLNDLDNPVAARAWIHAVGVGGRCLNDGVPVMKEFFKRFPLDSTKTKAFSDISARLAEEWKYKFARTATFSDLEPTPESRFSFWLAFGLLPDEQIALENDFPTISFDEVVGEYEEESNLLAFSKA